MLMADLMTAQLPKTEKIGKRTPKFRKQQKIDATKQQQALIDSIKATQDQLKQAYASFNQATDPDLIDSYVYEINALQSRHNYLSKLLRGDVTAYPHSI